MNIDQILDHIYILPEASKNSLKAYITEVSHPKGYCLMEAEKVVPYVYFIRKGIARAYSST